MESNAQAIELASCLSRCIASTADDADQFEFDRDRTKIIVWGETPAAVDELLANLRDGESCADDAPHFHAIGTLVRYVTEPTLMEPVVRIDVCTLLTHRDSITEVVQGLGGRIIGARRHTGPRCVILAEAPLAQCHDLSALLGARCDGEAEVSLGFSHYQKV